MLALSTWGTRGVNPPDVWAQHMGWSQAPRNLYTKDGIYKQMQLTTVLKTLRLVFLCESICEPDILSI